MDPNLRQQIDKAHELLKGSLYPEDHVYRSKIGEAFLTTERPSKSEIYSVMQNFYNSDLMMPISILAVYDSKFSIQNDIPDDWLAADVDKMAKHLLDYPKLAYVNYYYFEEPYQQAITGFDDILKVDEYRSFWSDFSAGIKGSADSYLTQLKQELKLELKGQLKQEVMAELKDQLKQEVKAELKHLLERMTSNWN